MAQSAIPISNKNILVDTAATANAICQRDANGDTLDRIVNASKALVSGGYVQEAQVTITATQALDDTATTWFVDATAANVNITLPSASSAGMPGRRLSFMKVDSGVHSMTTTPNGSEKINGASSKTTSTQYAGWTIQSDGSNWFVIP
jgi:hypothetical protein